MSSRKPRAVTTLEELKALPLETVIRDREGVVYEVGRGGFYAAIECGWGGNCHAAHHVDLPASVLFTPEVEA
jgi:hypothetical protein